MRRTASREAVDAFHVAAIAAGATDNGAPSEGEYGPYAAYALGPHVLADRRRTPPAQHHQANVRRLYSRGDANSRLQEQAFA